jgi:hypothetical protein
MDQLNLQSIEWALAHVSKFGDTDIFPPVFEYNAIRDSWHQIRAHLSQLDVEVYKPRAVQQMLMPKAKESLHKLCVHSLID